MKNLKNVDVGTNNPGRRDMADKITESFRDMPEHYRAPLMVFLQKSLTGDAEASQLRTDYATGELTNVKLWEEMHRRYGSKDSDQLIA